MNAAFSPALHARVRESRSTKREPMLPLAQDLEHRAVLHILISLSPCEESSVSRPQIGVRTKNFARLTARPGARRHRVLADAEAEALADEAVESRAQPESTVARLAVRSKNSAQPAPLCL